jgi:uncharacterized membrane protein YeaQ/YmgE (transglycosylase-associated protein family)
MKNVAPDPGSCTRLNSRLQGGARIFSLYAAVPTRAPQAEGREPEGELFSLRELPSLTDCRAYHFAGDKASAMGIIAWIALGTAVGLLANMLHPGKDHGRFFICLTCFTAALAASWAASLFRADGLFTLLRPPPAARRHRQRKRRELAHSRSARPSGRRYIYRFYRENRYETQHL